MSSVGSLIGRVTAGHSLFIPGQPQAYTPTLAKHFIIVEATLLPASLALAGVHYVSALCGHPERKTLGHEALQEAHARMEALTFWTSELSSNRSDPLNVAVRLSALTWSVSTFTFWSLFAAWSPATIHRAMGDANDILQRKYVTTTRGAPMGFYQTHIDRMTRVKQDHYNQQNLSLDLAAALFITVMFLLGRSSGSTLQSAAGGQLQPVANAPQQGWQPPPPQQQGGFYGQAQQYGQQPPQGWQPPQQ